MPHALAVRRILRHADGSFEIAFTFGQRPLPAGESGTLRWVGGEDSAKADVLDLDASMDAEQMLKLHLAYTWLQPNGSFANDTSVIGKTLVFEPGAANPIRIV